MTKIKSKIIAIILTALIFMAFVPSTVFAADYEGYLGMIDMNQYAFSIPSSYPAPFGGISRNRAVQLRVGSQVAYCVQFGVLTESGMGYNGTYDWDGLSASKKALINYTLMFGFDGTTRYGGTTDNEYWATQVLIWQIAHDTIDTGWEDGLCNALMGTGSVAKTIYYQIKANVHSFQTIPSFAARYSPSAPTHELTYNTSTGLYEVYLSDSNGALSSFNFQSTGYSMTRSDSTLHITTAMPQENVLVGSSKNLPTSSAGIIKYWHPSSSRYQTVVTYQIGGFNDPVNAYFNLKLSTGNGEIIKTTEDGQNLSGIQFTATGIDNGIVRSSATNAQGVASIVGLPVGRYTITENPDSHHPQYVTAEPQTIQIQAGQTTEVSFYNRIKKGQIALTKFEPSDDPLIKKPMAGIEFTVTHKDSGEVACVLVTDENGYAITPLLNYGRYIVTETYQEGYTIIDPFEVFVDTDGKIYSFLLENKVYEGMLRIIKVDVETGQTIPLSGTKFRLVDESGNDVVQTLYYPTPTQISVFETAADGTLMLPQPLTHGTYKLYEAEAPYGYLLNGEPLTFKITALNYTETLVVEFADAPAKGQISIEKTGEMVSTIEAVETDYGTMFRPVYAELPLAGVVFNVVADEDVYTPDGTLRYSKDEIVDIITTQNNGIATSKELYLGRYRVEEVSTVDGFVLDVQPRFVELAYQDQHTPIVVETLTLSNQRQTAAVSFLKDMERGIGRVDKPFLYVVFGLFTRGDIVAVDSTVIPAGSLMELITPQPDGSATVMTELPMSQYYIKELATAPGYILNETEYGFTFGYAGPSIKTVVIEINDGETINNEVLRGTGELIKIDTGGNRLSGAIFYLYTEHGVLLGEYKTPDNGEVLVEGLSYGRYYWIEKTAPGGFVYDGTQHWFEITIDGQIAEVTAVNRKPDIPNTGDDANLTMWCIFGGGAMLGLCASTIYLIRMVKRKREREEV